MRFFGCLPTRAAQGLDGLCGRLEKAIAKVKKEIAGRGGRRMPGESGGGSGGAGPPDLHRLRLGKQQPAQPGAIGQVGGHLATEGRRPPRSLIAVAGQLDHQIGAERREAAPLHGREGLPALQPHGGCIRAEYRAIGQTEASGAVEKLPIALLIRPGLQASDQPAVATTVVAACGCHRDQLAIGRQFQHRLGVGIAHLGERLRADLQAGG